MKQKEWDEESIKELTAQVSELRERDKWSTAKKRRNNFHERRQYFTPKDHINKRERIFMPWGKFALYALVANVLLSVTHVF